MQIIFIKTALFDAPLLGQFCSSFLYAFTYAELPIGRLRLLALVKMSRAFHNKRYPIGRCIDMDFADPVMQHIPHYSPDAFREILEA